MRARAGHLLLIALTGILAANVWLARSTFVPILRLTRIEYFLVGAPPVEWFVTVPLTLLALLGLHAACWRYVFRRERPLRFRFADVKYLLPLTLFGFSLAALANLAPATAGWMSVWSYLAIDLGPWLAGFVLVLLAAEVRPLAGDRLRSAIDSLRRWFLSDTKRLELALVAIAGIFVCAGSPLMRFGSPLHGDEPKYIRYGENLYQGHGLELSELQTLDELPVDYSPPLLRNVRLAVETIPVEWQELRADFRRLRDAGFSQRFNRARYTGNWFLTGKHGGVYQIHTPGLSFLLFPAYFVDRHLLSWKHDDPRFLDDLLASTTFTFVLYLLFGVLVFRLLNDYSGKPLQAWTLALIAILTLPLVNFPFQFYPEVAAGICVVVAIRYVLFGDRARGWSAALAGVCAGYLPWLHVRFLSVTGVLLIGALVLRRRERTARVFALGWAVPMTLLSFYTYHVTGSFLPTALYDARGEVLDLGSIGPGLFGFMFDGTFGVVPYAPILLLALVGVWPALSRRPAAALFCGLIVIATAATSAAHDFRAALTTPARYLVAVMPLTMLALGDAIETFWSSRLFRIVFGLLLLVSLETSWVYNRHHVKAIAELNDSSFSGWRINLMFPAIHGQSWQESGFSSLLLPLWAGVYVLLLLAPILAWRLAKRPKRWVNHASDTSLTFAVLIAFGILGTATSGLAGRTFDASYLLPPKEASVDSLQAVVERGCSPCVSSERGKVPKRAMLARSFQGFEMRAEESQLWANEPVLFEIRPAPGGVDAAWGTLDVDFGDGETLKGTTVLDRRAFSHTYRSAGYYEAVASLLTGSERFIRRISLTIHPRTTDRTTVEPAFDVREVPGLTTAVMTAPIEMTIRSVRIGRDVLCVDYRDTGTPFSVDRTHVWIARRTAREWQLSERQLDEDHCVRMESASSGAETGGRVAFLVARDSPQGLRRSQPMMAYWPDRDALIGSPIVARAQDGR